jgi:hypothetical protein
VTLTLKSGERIEAYIFNRQDRGHAGRLLRAVLHAGAPEKRRVSYAEIARIEFSGKDCAAGKQWEDWVRKYNERKAAGEKGIALEPGGAGLGAPRTGTPASRRPPWESGTAGGLP